MPSYRGHGEHVRTAFFLICLLPLGAIGADTDTATGLIRNPGWELVSAHCGGCHSHGLVTNQRADRQTWLDMIRWMQATQNLWRFPADTEAQILDYLAENYPPQPNRRRAPIPPSLMPALQGDLP